MDLQLNKFDPSFIKICKRKFQIIKLMNKQVKMKIAVKMELLALTAQIFHLINKVIN